VNRKKPRVPDQVRILIVEDSITKINQIKGLVERVLPAFPVSIDVEMDASAAAYALQSKRYDLLVLDMNLPLRSGERPRAEVGVEILRSIQQKKDFIRPRHIVGLSEYQELVERYSLEFAADMWYLVRYQDDTDSWARQLGRMLVHIADTASPFPAGPYLTDLAIITALHKVELESVLSLDATWEQVRYEDDDTAYYQGVFVRNASSLTVVAAAASRPGMTAATALAMKIISRYRPRVLGMAGIAAGVRAHFGDVLIADNVWDYGAGKAVPEAGGKSAFLPAPDAIPLSPNLKSRFEVFGLEREVLRNIQSAWNGPTRTYAPLQSWIGPIASGASVLADRSIVDELVLRNRKLVGVEMEAYGVFTAARDCVDPRPQTFVVKSVCDFGDGEKNDDFQAYAAYTSARYLYEFAMSELTGR